MAGLTRVPAFELEQANALALRAFGIHELRPEQRLTIGAIAEGRDVLIVQPTGSGKSLCYQLPALLLDRPTVVVSPLLALISDQVEKLRRRGLPVLRIDSTIRAAERRTALSTIAAGGSRIVLTTPESLEAFDMREALAHGGGVALLAVDEAHCISEWGHDFRPAYLRIPTSVAPLQPRSILALTATATVRVQNEIAATLRLANPVVVASPPHRPNLVFSVECRSGTERIERLGRLVRRLPRPGIVYCATVASVDRIAAALRAARVPSAQYHGRMKAAEKEDAFRRYMSRKRRLVMVATSAFGMGVDKPNIRYIIHYQAPASLEQYVQETGRAGRDGRLSQCVLLFDATDLSLHARLHAQARPSPDGLARLVAALIAWSETDRPVTPSTLALSSAVTTGSAKALLAVLGERGLVRSERDRYELAVPKEQLSALGKDLSARFETSRREDQKKREAVLAYAEAASCRSAFLRRYFGEQAPPRCGLCDCCRSARVHPPACFSPRRRAHPADRTLALRRPRARSPSSTEKPHLGPNARVDNPRSRRP